MNIYCKQPISSFGVDIKSQARVIYTAPILPEFILQKYRVTRWTKTTFLARRKTGQDYSPRVLEHCNETTIWGDGACDGGCGFSKDCERVFEARGDFYWM